MAQNVGDSILGVIDMWQRNQLNQAELQLAREREERLKKESDARLGQIGLQNKLTRQQISRSESAVERDELLNVKTQQEIDYNTKTEPFRVRLAEAQADAGEEQTRGYKLDNEKKQFELGEAADSKTATDIRNMMAGNQWIKTNTKDTSGAVRQEVTPAFSEALANGDQQALEVAATLLNRNMKGSAKVIGLTFDDEGKISFVTRDPNKQERQGLGVVTPTGTDDPKSPVSKITPEKLITMLETQINGYVVPTSTGGNPMQGEITRGLLTSVNSVTDADTVVAQTTDRLLSSGMTEQGRALADTSADIRAGDEEEYQNFARELIEGIQMPAGAAPEFGSDAPTQALREEEISDQQGRYGRRSDKYTEMFTYAGERLPTRTYAGPAGVVTASQDEISSTGGLAEIYSGVQKGTRQSEEQFNQAVAAQNWFKSNADAMGERFANSEGGALEGELNTLGGRAFYEKYKDTDFSRTPQQVFDYNAGITAATNGDLSNMRDAAANNTLPTPNAEVTRHIRQKAQEAGIDPNRANIQEIRKLRTNEQIALISMAASLEPDATKRGAIVEQMLNIADTGTTMSPKDISDMRINQGNLALRRGEYFKSLRDEARDLNNVGLDIMDKISTGTLDEDGAIKSPDGAAKTAYRRLATLYNSKNTDPDTRQTAARYLIPATINMLESHVAAGDFDDATWVDTFQNWLRDSPEASYGASSQRIRVTASPDGSLSTIYLVDNNGNVLDTPITGRDFNKVFGPNIQKAFVKVALENQGVTGG